MKVIELKLKGLKCIIPKRTEDERGIFMESYQQHRYCDIGLPLFSQDNLVYSKQRVLRGMHFQSYPGQDKLITVLQGKIYDVALDIRPFSNTFGQYEALYLDDQERKQFFIPHGFAHGYCVVSEQALVHYKVSEVYHPSAEKGFRFNDPVVQIQWPISNPIVSLRDLQSPMFQELNFQEWFS